MDVLAEWRKIPAQLDRVLSTGELDAPFGPEKYGLTRRETAHHIAEANVVAAGIVIAALGSPGSVFDWSWMMPFGPWLERLDYRHKPLEPTRKLVEALNAWVAAQIEPLPDGLERVVLLRDEPGGEPRRATVADVLAQEIEHAREHFESPGLS